MPETTPDDLSDLTDQRPADGLVPPTLATVVDQLDRIYPQRWARDWDAVGLVCGDPHALVRTVHLAVDPVADVVEEAITLGADLLVVHHPLLLRAVHSVAADDPKGAVLHRLIRAGCALYVAHTNADVAVPGVSDALARILGLTNLRPLAADPEDATDKLITFVPTDHADAVLDAMAAAGAGTIGGYDRCAWTTEGTGTFEPGPDTAPHTGEPGRREQVRESRVEVVVPRSVRRRVVDALVAAHPYEEPAYDLLSRATADGQRGVGRVGDLETPTTLERFADVVARALPHTAQGVRVAGDPQGVVRTVAVCGGSGDSLFADVRASGADAFVTADLRHHPASEARERAGDGPPYLVDVAHWASEWPWLHGCADRLAAALEDVGTTVDVTVSALCTDPWTFRVPSSGGLVR